MTFQYFKTSVFHTMMLILSFIDFRIEQFTRFFMTKRNWNKSGSWPDWILASFKSFDIVLMMIHFQSYFFIDLSFRNDMVLFLLYISILFPFILTLEIYVNSYFIAILILLKSEKTLKKIYWFRLHKTAKNMKSTSLSQLLEYKVIFSKDLTHGEQELNLKHIWRFYSWNDRETDFSLTIF